MNVETPTLNQSLLNDMTPSAQVNDSKGISHKQNLLLASREPRKIGGGGVARVSFAPGQWNAPCEYPHPFLFHFIVKSRDTCYQ